MTSYSGKIIRKTPVTPTQTSASGVWTTADAAAAVKNNLWPVPGVPDPISRSLRFRASATAYLTRTYGTPTNNKIYTWSMWVKRGDLTATTVFVLASCPTAGFLSFGDGTNPVIRWNDGTADIITSSVYRDPSAWYHIVVAVDTTQATAANRVKIYVNGVQLTAFSTAGYPSLNASQNWNSAGVHNIGRRVSTSTLYYDGYMTEVNFIDGQQLTPSSFGTTNAFTGAWIPMPYTGTYGANGFYLNFKDNTSTTTLGYDYSGNANNWNTTNFSVTSGVTYDSMLDVPTSWVGYSATTDTTAVTRGNYCVISPIDKNLATVSDGNLRITGAGGLYQANGSMAFPASGKWYFEATVSANSNASNGLLVGIASPTRVVGASIAAAGTYGVYGSAASAIYSNGSVVASGLPVLNSTYTYQLAVDVDNGKAWVGYNTGSTQYWYNSTGGTTGDPAAGTNPTFTVALAGFFPLFQVDSASGYFWYANFGQRPFAQSVPTGFSTLCTTNISPPSIVNGASYMAATLYTGNGSAGRVITVPNITEVGFAWVKLRSGIDDHRLANTVTGGNKHLKSNATDAESTSTNVIQAFSANTFTVGSDNSVNANGSTYVAWTWAANGAAASNTNGTITSQVSANTTAGFSVVTYTGSGAAATVGHGLGVAPSMIIVKNRTTATGWLVYHASVGNTGALILNSTSATVTSVDYWNNTSPTSSVFTVGVSNAGNQSTNNLVAYCFAAVTGYSAFGKYTGNGAADGPFIYTGFRPRFVMMKASSAAGDWIMVDTSRDPENVMDARLQANASDAESTTTFIDSVSNGFKVRSTNANVNASSVTITYAAFAELPFNYSNAR